MADSGGGDAMNSKFMKPFIKVADLPNSDRLDSKRFKAQEVLRLSKLDLHVIDIREANEIGFEEGDKVIVKMPDSNNGEDWRGTIKCVDYIDRLVEDVLMGSSHSHGPQFAEVPIKSGFYTVQFDDIIQSRSLVSWRLITRESSPPHFGYIMSDPKQITQKPLTLTAVVAPSKYLITRVVIANQICECPLDDINKYSSKEKIRIVQTVVDRYVNEFHHFSKGAGDLVGGSGKRKRSDKVLTAAAARGRKSITLLHDNELKPKSWKDHEGI
jgi:hypothetical protein